MNRWVKLARKRRRINARLNRAFHRSHRADGVKIGYGSRNSTYFVNKTAKRRLKNKAAKAARRRNRD